MTKINVAEAKSRFSEILGRVAHGGETILITRRGRPMAKLVPPDEVEKPHPADAEGWLDDDDPFFEIMAKIDQDRSKHVPRVLAKASARGPVKSVS